MAEVTAMIERTNLLGGMILTWERVEDGDTCVPFDLQGIVSEISVHVAGVFGGATVSFQGSINGSTYVALKQLDNEDASLAAEDIFSLLDRPRFLLPVITGGSSSEVAISVMVRK